MKRIFWLRLLIFGIILTQLASGCGEKDENNYLFTGRVIDQVTSEPVSGAIVRYGHLFLGERDHDLVKMPQYTLTGADGKYKLLVPKIIFDDRFRNPGPKIYSENPDYAGSNVMDASIGRENMDLKLYTASELHIHVKNDTISNDIDGTSLWIRGDPQFWPYPKFLGRVVQGRIPTTQFSCIGRDFDTVIVIKNLWGNLSYYVGFGISNINGPYDSSYSVKLIPGTINYLDVTF